MLACIIRFYKNIFCYKKTLLVLYKNMNCQKWKEEKRRSYLTNNWLYLNATVKSETFRQGLTQDKRVSQTRGRQTSKDEGCKEATYETSYKW